MDETMIRALELAVGNAPLAALIFYMYRKDALRWGEEWKGSSKILIDVIAANTAALVKLTERLERR